MGTTYLNRNVFPITHSAPSARAAGNRLETLYGESAQPGVRQVKPSLEPQSS
jgi:hypothetical protein